MQKLLSSFRRNFPCLHSAAFLRKANQSKLIIYVCKGKPLHKQWVSSINQGCEKNAALSQCNWKRLTDYKLRELFICTCSFEAWFNPTGCLWCNLHKSLKRSFEFGCVSVGEDSAATNILQWIDESSRGFHNKITNDSWTRCAECQGQPALASQWLCRTWRLIRQGEGIPSNRGFPSLFMAFWALQCETTEMN